MFENNQIEKPDNQPLSSYRAINEEEVQDPTQKKLRNEFDSELIKKLGQPMSEQALKYIDPIAVTPEHDL